LRDEVLEKYVLKDMVMEISKNTDLEILNATSFDSFSSTGGQRCIVIVEKLFAVEGIETLEDTVSDSASSNGSNDFAFEIECVTCNIRYLPVCEENGQPGRRVTSFTPYHRVQSSRERGQSFEQGEEWT
jgi:hypothetical protein